MVCKKKNFNEAQKTRVDNVGVLLAAGFIAGEALIGLLFAGFAFGEVQMPAIFSEPPFTIGAIVIVIVALFMIFIPARNAGNPNEPAPPKSM